MSADSPRRTVRGVPAIVPPQVVSDPSIIDSVAGFINDVTLTNQPQVDPKDTITWARFETQADISDPQFGDEDFELEGCAPPPLILVLGYGVGIQVWAIPANGEAVEVLSWRYGNVTALRVLPTPTSTDVNFDRFSDKRPLMALCEGPTNSPGNQYSTVNFVSLKDGTTVKSIKFKNSVLDILTNKTFVVITFPERIAVFDARSLEDHLSITTCYPSPGINPNPVALGHRWLAYSENKLIHTKRSQGGCEVEGVPSYTATMLNAAKSFSKGLKEFGETVAAGLKGSASGGGLSSKPGSFESTSGDTKQPGVVTIFDIKHPIKDISPTSGTPISITGDDPIIAHFVAHSDAIVAMEFDPSGMLLLTADKRGHDFHIFKIFNHAMSSNLSAVHHLYILHRGDTTAKVQDIVFSSDSRWVAVSSLRGTTHVFPITPYGGPAGVRTHTNPYVVNRLSRFHRSAGLSPDGRSSSPISGHSEITQYNSSCMPYNNATIPPFPKPIVVNPLAKLRQPSALGSPPGSAQNSYSRSSHGRQRLSSLSDENGKSLSVCAVFAKARSWLLDGPKLARDSHKVQQRVVDSLFIMAGHGALIQYDLDVKIAQSVAKEKVCDESLIELEVEAKAQWNLGRKDNSVEVQPPLLLDNWLMKDMTKDRSSPNSGASVSPQIDDWVSQVEIMTHAGPGRRLWMGPQCVFKTYNTPSGSSLNHIDTEAVEVPINVGSSRPGRSSPMNMPLPNSGRSSVPFVIESGSYSSIDQSPRLMERFCHDNINSEFDLSQGETRLKEDLADAMRESPSTQHKDTGITSRVRMSSLSAMPPTSAKNSGSDCCYNTKCTSNQLQHHLDRNFLMMSPQNQPARSVVLIEKVVNPQGTVTTITRSPNDHEYDSQDPYAWVDTDYVIHENFDEALFRPVVTIFCDDQKSLETLKKQPECDFVAPEPIKTDLIVPVIEGSHPDFECGKPPELIRSELIVPVVEERKEKRKVNPEGNGGRARNKEKSKRDEEKDCNRVDFDDAKPDEENISQKKGKGSRMKKSREDVEKENQSKGRSLYSSMDTLQTDEVANKTEAANFEGSDQEVKPTKSNGKAKKILKFENVDLSSSHCDLEYSLKCKSAKGAKSQSSIENKSGNPLEVSSSKGRNEAIQKESSSKFNGEVEFKQETKIEDHFAQSEHVNVDGDIDNDGGLHFYDKFGSDSPKSDSSADLKIDHVKIDVEFPSLGEKKRTKKHKDSNSSYPSPQLSPTVKKKQPQKSGEGKLTDDDAVEIVTITLPNKKKQKKNSSPDDQGKKSGDTEKSGKYSTTDKTDATDGGGSKEKGNKNGKKGNKNKEFPKLSIESALNTDFTDTFLPPLSPLEPFESNFDNIHFKDTTDHNESLINLDSPPQELTKTKSSTNDAESEENKALRVGYDKFYFALDESGQDESSASGKENQQLHSSAEKRFSKSLHRKNSSENEQYLSLDKNYQENTSSSSEDMDEAASIRKKTRQKIIDDDEELRPLISTATSGFSITSSTTGKSEADTTDTIALEIAKASVALEFAKVMAETLQDSNQSDSSDQANVSDPDVIDTTALEITNTTTPPRGECDAPKVSAQSNIIESGSTTNQHHNGKKKLKKKKR